MGADSKEAENLKIKIENQKASVTKTRKELESYTKTLDDLENGVEDATKALDDMDDKARDAGDGFTVFKGAVATFAGNIATSAVSGIKNLAGSILGLAESTREYRDTMSKLDTAGEDAGYGADYAKKKYEDLYGVLGDETATATTVSNFMAMNAEQSTLDSLLNSSIGIWAKYGDSIPLDGLAESINETAKVGAVTGGLADALNWAGISEDKFNEKLEKCNSEQERQKLIADTLNKTYGDLSTSYQENNKNVIEANKANASYTESMAEMGAKVEPIMTSVREGFTKILQKILELTEGVDFNAIATSIAGAFDYFINTILPKIVDGLQWVIDHKDIIMAGIVGIGTAFLTWKVVGLITSITSAIKGMMLATEGATVAQKLLNLAMKANPIGIVITLIMGLVSAFVVLWNKSEAFRNFFINMWENIKNFVGKAVDSIGGFFSGLWDDIKSIWSGVGTWFSDKVIKPVTGFFSGMWTNLKNGASDAWSGIKSVFSKVGSFFSDTFSSAWKKVKDIFSTGGKIFDGIKDGIVNAFKSIVNGIIKGINKVVALPFNAINKVLKSIKKVNILGVEPFSWLGTIDVPQIPLLAKGGVVDGATLAMIGEAGKEAVVPLENNTGWLDEVASRIVSKGGVVGGTAQTVNNNYNYEFNQTNNSPKSLSRLDIYRQTKNQLAFAKGV
jgi:methyl-accepting chemotaxis protein